MERETVIDITPGAKKAIKDTEVMVKTYQNYHITLPTQYTIAAEDLKKIKGKYKELEDIRKSATAPLDEAKRKIMDWFRKPLEALATIESIIKRELLSWQQKQEQIRRAEEARLAEIQRKEAEKLAERAHKAEETGKVEKAEELRQQAQEKEMFTPTVTSTVEKIKGISTRTYWRYRVTNEALIPRDYLIPNHEKLADIAEATKGTLKVEGIEFYSEEGLSATRR